MKTFEQVITENITNCKKRKLVFCKENEKV